MRRALLLCMAALTSVDAASAQQLRQGFRQVGPAVNVDQHYGLGGGFGIGGSVSDTLVTGDVTSGFTGPAAPSPNEAQRRAISAILSAYLNYNIRVGTQGLLGIEGDIGMSPGDANVSVPVPDPATTSLRLSVRTSLTGSLRARFGIVNGPALIYATGGLSWLRVTGVGDAALVCDGGSSIGNLAAAAICNAPGNSFGSYSTTQNLVGPVFGAGVEHIAGNNLKLRGEYLFAYYPNVDLGNAAFQGSNSEILSSTVAGRIRSHTLRLMLGVGLSP
jgi:opacity protein-like surface antigen